MPGPRQHTIPSFHLAQFAGEDGRVWIFDAEGAAPRADRPDNIGCERNFYSVEKPDGTWDNTLDQWITDVEGKADPIYRRLLDGDLPETDQQKADFAMYLALMMVRTRGMLRMATDMIAKGMQTMAYATASHPAAFEARIREVEAKTGRKITPEVKELIRQRALNPSDGIMKVAKDAGIMRFKAVDGIAPLFVKKHWTIMTATEGEFITSDNPVLRETDPKTRHPVLGDQGLMNKTSVVTFPLSRESALVMTWSDAMPAAIGVKRPIVDGVNMSLAASSDQYLYGPENRPEIEKLAVQFKDKRPSMNVSGFGPAGYAETEVKRRWTKL